MEGMGDMSLWDGSRWIGLEGTEWTGQIKDKYKWCVCSKLEWRFIFGFVFFIILFLKNLFYLFIFGCIGSSLLRAGFL